MTKPPFLRAEHCMGKVADAPASPPPKSNPSSAIVNMDNLKKLKHYSTEIGNI